MEAIRGQAVQVQIVVDPGSNGISAGEIRLAYNPALVEVIDITPGNLLGTNTIEGNKSIDNTEGRLSYAIARVRDTSVPTSPGTLATISLRIPGNASTGNALLELTKVAFTNQASEFIANVGAVGGRINVR